MPLNHLNDGRLVQLEGVRFVMTEDGSAPIPCIVSHEALQDLAGTTGFSGSEEEVFTAYRELIESVASATFDLGGPKDRQGRVLVTSAALTQAYQKPG